MPPFGLISLVYQRCHLDSFSQKLLEVLRQTETFDDICIIKKKKKKFQLLKYARVTRKKKDLILMSRVIRVMLSTFTRRVCTAYTDLF